MLINDNKKGPYCKDAFKALREKYVREKEKCLQYGNSVKKWELYDMMTFLDPHIVLRKGNTFTPTPSIRIKVDTEQFDNPEYLTENLNQDLIKELITLVRESRLIWDKRHLNHGDTRMREYLWKNIGQKLNTDGNYNQANYYYYLSKVILILLANVCKLRWKALREKYIRQKHRQSDGEPAKWQFMKDMSFLDNVIQFRKNKWLGSQSMDSESNLEASVNITDSELDDHTNDSYKQPVFKYNNYQNINDEPQHVPSKSTPDSTLIIEPKRQRTDSDSTDMSNNKKDYVDESQIKSPEQIFGELVAAMLATKTASEKNRIMMKIMSVLTDSTN